MGDLSRGSITAESQSWSGVAPINFEIGTQNQRSLPGPLSLTLIEKEACRGGQSEGVGRRRRVVVVVAPLVLLVLLHQLRMPSVWKE